MYKIFLLLALSQITLYSQTSILEPWEPGEGMINLLQKGNSVRQPHSPLDYISLVAISFYQSSVSDKSVSRCPFEISCSRFAVKAIEKYSLLGYPIFIDRYFFRENASAFSLYTKKLTNNGIVKLDDKIYLSIFE